MTADVHQVMRILSIRGVMVRLEHGRLLGRSVHGPIPDDMAGLIRYNREPLIVYLAEEDRLALTVTNVLALPALGRDRWESEVLAGHAYPAIDRHYREALRRVRAELASRAVNAKREAA